MKLRRIGLIAAATVLVAGLPIGGGADAQAGLHLPNVQPSTDSINIGNADFSGGNERAIRFGTRIHNRGPYTLDIIAIPEGPTSAGAWQCTLWALHMNNPRKACALRERAGTLIYHPQHTHWHVDDYAINELRRLTVNGDPDMTPAGLVRAGEKQSFCLLDYFQDDPSAGPGNVLYQCAYVQGITAGWSDYYGPWLSGQQIRHRNPALPQVPDGDYAIVTTLDGLNTFAETNNNDNMGVVFVRLSNNGLTIEQIG